MIVPESFTIPIFSTVAIAWEKKDFELLKYNVCCYKILEIRIYLPHANIGFLAPLWIYFFVPFTLHTHTHIYITLHIFDNLWIFKYFDLEHHRRDIDSKNAQLVQNKWYRVCFHCSSKKIRWCDPNWEKCLSKFSRRPLYYDLFTHLKVTIRPIMVKAPFLEQIHKILGWKI